MNQNVSNKLAAVNSVTASNNCINSTNSSRYLNINTINILLKSGTMNAPISMSSSNSNSNVSLYNHSNLQFSSSFNKLPLSLSQNQLLSDNLNSWNRSLNINNSNNNHVNMIMQKNTSSHSPNNFQLNHQIAQPPATCSLNNTLFVGNLHASLQEIDLIQVFRPFGNIVECCKKWLHFGFVKFITEEEACHAYVTLNGFRLKGRPMRLEFQNRTKKARIKALIAQATLQSSNSNGNNFPTNDGYNLASFQLNDERQNQHYQSQYHYNQQNSDQINHLSSFKHHNSLLECLNKKIEDNNMFDSTNNFFNTDQLIKFANSVDIELQNKQQPIRIPQFEFNFDLSENIENNDKSKNDEMLLNLVKKTISPIDSPQHDLSSSSDSGCRSVSFIADCDDSAINTITSNSICPSISKCLKSNEQYLSVEKSLIRKKVNDEISLSEHLEFTCSNSNINTNFEKENSKESLLTNKSIQIEKHDDNDVCDDDTDSDCDTSDDASELPIDSDCLNDLDLIEYNDLTNFDSDEINRYIQVVDQDGSIARKKLHYGCIYRSINQTMSLFIEPNDILKLMNTDEYNEYILFPNEDVEKINYNLDCDCKSAIVDHSSNSELIESIELVIKNNYYL